VTSTTGRRRTGDESSVTSTTGRGRTGDESSVTGATRRSRTGKEGSVAGASSRRRTGKEGSVAGASSRRRTGNESSVVGVTGRGRGRSVDGVGIKRPDKCHDVQLAGPLVCLESTMRTVCRGLLVRLLSIRRFGEWLPRKNVEHSGGGKSAELSV